MASKTNLENLHDLIRSHKLYIVCYYCFHKEETARVVYKSLASKEYWLPIKCVVALRRADVFLPWWVVLYIGEPVYQLELPKPQDTGWSWSEYLEIMGLPKQDEFDQAKTDQKLWHNERIATLLDYFPCTSLERGIYECLVCHKDFSSRDTLMKHLKQDPKHGGQFNQAMIDQFNTIVSARLSEIAGTMAHDAESLVSTLRDRRNAAFLRRQAASELGELADEKGIDALIDALGDLDDEVRKNAASALLRAGSVAITSLVQALTRKLTNQMKVVEILDELDWKPTNDMEKSYYLFAVQKWDDLADLGEAAVDLLVRAVLSGHQRAAENLRKIGESAVTPLIKAFEGKDARIRKRAALGLAAIGGPSVVDYFIKALKDGRWAIRCEAADTLGRIGDARAIQPLTESMKDDNQSVVAAAKLSLQLIKLRRL